MEPLKYICIESTEFSFPFPTPRLPYTFFLLFYAALTLTHPVYICAPGVNTELKKSVYFEKGSLWYKPEL